MQSQIKRLKLRHFVVIAIFLVGLYFSADYVKKSTGKKIDAISLTVNTEVGFQEIDNFGASDAWSIQFVGKNWPETKKSRMAELLFSTKNNELGNPEGIGLSLWRFNLGAGSAEQGNLSGIRDEWRRAESFLNMDGSYDWNKLEGQIWFAKQAKEYGVEDLLLFSNSPPVTITRNGKAFTNNKNESNLNPDDYTRFADYLVTVAEGIEDMGLPVRYLSPINEPQWDWEDGGQEGTPFWNEEIASLTKAIDKEIVARNLDLKIDIPEAAQINYLYRTDNKRGRSNLIYTFFDKNSDNYLNDLSSLAPSVSGHSYFTTSPFNQMMSQRQEVASSVSLYPGLKYWMTEYCILGDNAGEIKGNGRDLGINSALYLARVIHSDLVFANANAWHWWIAVSPYDYKDGLIYIDKDKYDGDFHESKMLWALGNYSKFIRPGYRRVEIKNGLETKVDKDFLYSAYKNPANDEVVVVLVNSAKKDKNITLAGLNPAQMEFYVTSEEKNLYKSDLLKNGIMKIPNNSIVTVTIKS